MPGQQHPGSAMPRELRDRQRVVVIGALDGLLRVDAPNALEATVGDSIGPAVDPPVICCFSSEGPE